MEIFLFAVLLGLAPAMIAQSKGRNFVAWWLYGTALFIVALPHALVLKPIEVRGSRKCPYCADIIKEEAIVCRYCGRDLPAKTVDRVACPKCGRDIEADALECRACGSRLFECQACRAIVDEKTEVCPKCRTPLGRVT